jgi:hypothetical protein
MIATEWPNKLSPLWQGLEPSGPIDVFIVSYGGGHINAVLPVAKSLQESGYVVALLPLTTAIGQMVDAGLPYISYQHLGFSDWEEIEAVGVKLAGSLSGGGTVPLEETIAYLGANYLDLVHQHGAKNTKKIWEDAGRQAFYPINIMRRLLQTLKPRLVLSTNSPRSERAVITAASEQSIPSICLVDLFALQAISWIKDPEYGTEVHVLNDAVKDSFVKHGRPTEHIHVTGNPAFDSLFIEETKDRAVQMRNEREWDVSKKTILYASSPEAERHPFTGVTGDPKLPRILEEKLRRFVRNRQDLELIIRRHPSEEPVTMQSPNVHISTQEEDISALLHAVDCVVVTVSTVGLQAWMIGLPVICVNFSIFSDDAPYPKFGMATGIENWDELDDALTKALATQSSPLQYYSLATQNVCKRVSILLEKTQ